ncbi:hypothetical protein K7B10_32635 [Streptomyces flavotricini]|uniref:Uncharacterized protein n=1 Tax=Streptomyces flavotricini TaxID=66888 RepID=A0ABS8EE82_9ACTN|nr:hypothetical protein [Streptomyces flavotricini]MCC0099441.1 hypothetical protein [Streptomyces flavotricini]
MTDQPETPSTPESSNKPESKSMMMSRLIRELPQRDAAEQMRESIRRSVARRKNGENK